MKSRGGLEWEEAAELSTAPLPLPTGQEARGVCPPGETTPGAERPTRACQHQQDMRGSERAGPGQGAGLAGVLGEKLSYKKILKDVLDN